MLNEDELRSMGFIKQGKLLCEGPGQIEFQYGALTKKNSPGIYLWLHRKNELLHDVKYVGKAGNGLSARMRQHVAGLKKASFERLDHIKRNSGEEKCLEVWFRESEVWEFGRIFKNFKGPSVSAYSMEEEALITHFDPPLNRATTPAMRANARKPQEIGEGFIALDFEITGTNGQQRDLWTDAVHSLTSSHKYKIGKVLDLVLKFLKQLDILEKQWPLDYRVIGKYMPHPIPNQPLLVLGKFVKTRFSPGTTVVYISLENELISFSPKVQKKLPMQPDKGGAYSLDVCISMLVKIKN